MPRSAQPAAHIAGATMRTTVGAVRTRNEDAAYVDAGLRYFVVADGMGGHSAGDVASAMAVSAVRTTLEADGALDQLAGVDPAERGDRVRGLLDTAVHAANHAILTRAMCERDKHGMGTTLEVAVAFGREVFVAHAGDSRTYVVRDGVARQATVDHTLAEAMYEAGSITRLEADRSPLRSTLSSAIGVQATYRLDHVRLSLYPGDALLLCTDGLYDYFDGRELGRRLRNGSADAALDDLIYEACDRGGHDNATGIVIEMSAARRPRLSSPSPLADVPDTNLTALVDHALREARDTPAPDILLEY